MSRSCPCWLVLDTSNGEIVADVELDCAASGIACPWLWCGGGEIVSFTTPSAVVLLVYTGIGAWGLFILMRARRAGIDLRQLS